MLDNPFDLTRQHSPQMHKTVAIQYITLNGHFRSSRIYDFCLDDSCSLATPSQSHQGQRPRGHGVWLALPPPMPLSSFPYLLDFVGHSTSSPDVGTISTPSIFHLNLIERLCSPLHDHLSHILFGCLLLLIHLLILLLILLLLL